MGILKKITKPKAADDKKASPAVHTAKATVKKTSADNEVMAAIATAISLFSQDVHDNEEYKMTIKRIDRPYSPWSSKLYMMRKWPR